eukprot:CAMPEP_0205941454 /NCGR_PEP_ID=MMETSP1325-20131115/54916_1 /ASSEMBLY_ACC=CAM_ASM_000708 /TAXON_ID=236786 /ORGANISM="Florenciella sp., Strain RCC1007" /LENGTH=123 /DNA_ID=CAMNT_0053312085 /DNA_START=105 /DNA_END=476 /DNA_ORIENTATION=+
MSSSSSDTEQCSATFSNHASGRTRWHVEHASSPPQAPSNSMSLSWATSSNDAPTSASTSWRVPSQASTNVTLTEAARGAVPAYPRDGAPEPVVEGTWRAIFSKVRLAPAGLDAAADVAAATTV